MPKHKKTNNHDPLGNHYPAEPDAPAKAGCAKYGTAVMNLVMGQELGMPKEALFDHLRQCKECRAELFEWRDTWTVMRMEADAKKPAHKQKMTEMVARLQKDLLCDVTKAGQPADRDKEIGTPAGHLWNLLAKEKIIRVVDIPNKMNKYDIDQALGAYGWLANEKKVEIIYHDIGKCVKLTKDEEAKIPEANM